MQNLLDMKKVFLILLLTITLAGFVVPSHLAFAGEPGASGAAGGLATVAPEAATANAQAEAAYSAEQGAAGAAIANSAGVQRGLDVAIDCASAAIPIFGAAKADDCLASIIRVFTSMLLKLAEVILYFVGLFLNFFVEQLVVNMGSFVTSSDAVGIQIAWRIMRDLANLAIIGGLIATAIGTILHLATINAQKLLVRLIIAALLVNFSFFFAGAIIDSSNFLATTIYRATIQTERCAEACTIVDRFERVIQSPHKNLAEYLQGRVEGLRGGEQDSQWMGVLQDILSVVLIAVTIFVFLSAASLLLGRFVALILILITSPIGIAGMAIPQISKYAKEWWEALFSQAFFAPVYFLLVGFSLTILDNSNGAFSGNDTNLIGGLLTFMVATVFMLQSLKIAKGMSEAAKRLTDVYKASDKVAGWMPKAYTTLLATGAVESIGRGSDFVLDRYNRWRSSEPKGLIGKGLRAVLPDKYIKKGLEGVAKAKFGGDEGYVDARGRRRGRLAELDLTAQRQKAKADLDAALPEANKARDAHLKDLTDGLDPQTDPAAKKRYNAFIEKTAAVERALTNFREASDYYKKRDPKFFEELAPYLSSGDFADVINDKEVPKSIRDNMREKRFANVLELVEQANGFEKGSEEYNVRKSALFNLFKRGGFAMSDFDALLQYKPELDHNVFFLEGITTGARNKTQETSVFGKAQQRLAKETWRTTLKAVVASTGVAETGDIQKDSERGKTWEATDIHSDRFVAGVETWKTYIAGKQPHELPSQISDSMVTAPVFAAAITTEKLEGLVGKKDDQFLNEMTDNLVRLSEDETWGTPEMRGHVQGVIAWMQDNPQGQTMYGDRLRASMAKYGKGKGGASPNNGGAGGGPKPGNGDGGGNSNAGGQNTPNAPSGPNIPSGEEPVGEQGAPLLTGDGNPSEAQASTLGSVSVSSGGTDPIIFEPVATTSEEPIAESLVQTNAPVVATTTFNDFGRQFDLADTSERSIQMAREYYGRATDDQILSIRAEDIIKPAVLGGLKASTLQKVVQRWRNDPALLRKMQATLLQLNDRVNGLPAETARLVTSEEFKNLTTPKE